MANVYREDIPSLLSGGDRVLPNGGPTVGNVPGYFGGGFGSKPLSGDGRVHSRLPQESLGSTGNGTGESLRGGTTHLREKKEGEPIGNRGTRDRGGWEGGSEYFQ